MTLLGLELSDAGIMAAAGSFAELLAIDGQATESPGFALPQKNGLLVGKVAESKAHLFPRQILNHFWDRLDTEPIEQHRRYGPQNNAEIVYSHLALIRQQIQKHGDQIVMAVPGFYDREQLGLILGITQELSLPVKGFVPMALAASSVACPHKMLLYLDIHLHRIEVIYLKQGEHLTIEDSVTATQKGLIRLYREWVDAIAQEFVRTTRFDPLHQATSEQELHDRLPGILSQLQQNPTLIFEINGGAARYNITLKRDLITRKAEPIYAELNRLIARIRNKHPKDKPAVVLQVSHRLTRLPGCREMLATIKDAQIIELDRGAGAYGVLGIWNRLSDQHSSKNVSFFTSRPWQPSHREYDQLPSGKRVTEPLPTHLLYRSIAYPITENPLIIGREMGTGNTGVHIYGQTAGNCARHCSVELQGREIVLNDFSTDGTFVNGIRVNGSMALKLGQTIRLGTDGQQLQLIACLEKDET